ncbi:hypothetical protein RPALISO_171 [Ruegeria phage RpAliso]|nr:hypothetical protein RPALISO_171 [Ruegeria phage RpAliso]
MPKVLTRECPILSPYRMADIIIEQSKTHQLGAVFTNLLRVINRDEFYAPDTRAHSNILRQFHELGLVEKVVRNTKACFQITFYGASVMQKIEDKISS